MAVQLSNSGYFEIIYGKPWKGINVQEPENQLDDGYVPVCTDFTFRNQELRSRPAFNPTLVAGPATGNGNILALIPNPSGTVQIGAIFGGANTSAFYLSLGDFKTWNALTNNTSMIANFPVSWRILASNAYFTNLNSQEMDSWNGGTTLTINTAQSSGVNIGAAYIDELDNHVVMAYTNESSNSHPNRVRWSAINLPAQWDPTVNVNAGFQDFLDISDQITGLMMLGRVGYIFRNNGITEMDPTGNGVAPFSFNHLWASQYGIGNVLAYTTAQYGTTGVFISSEQIYAVSSYELSVIGGMARDAIMADLSFKPTGTTLPTTATIVPYLRMGILSTGFQQSPLSTLGASSFYPFFAYMLFIPQKTGTKVWVYDFAGQNWVTWFLPGFQVTAKPILALVPDVPSLGAGTPGSTNMMLLPLVSTTTGKTFLGTFDPSSFNDSQQGSTITFKSEDIVPNRVPTVRRVILTYRDLGQATVTASITVTDDNGVVQTYTASPTQIGTPVATGLLLTKFIDIEATGFRPTLSLSRAANGGPLSISTIVMTGTVEKGSL